MQPYTHPIRHPASARHGPAERSGSALAFTMIELLVVIIIIVVAVGMAYPMMGGMMRGNRIEAGLNSVNVAIAAARTASTQAKASMDPPVTGARFSGAAVIFTPAGEMRLVEHDQLAADSFGTFLAASSRHGYADLANRPYITLPPGSAVVGITRNSNGAPLLLAPPFAIHFNEYGNLVAGQSNDHIVYYDGNYDTKYVVGAGGSRQNNYDPDPYDPNATSTPPGKDANGSGRYILPFDQIETVIGVIVYDRNSFRAKGFNLQASVSGGGIDTSNNSAGDWILKNGKPLLVDRYSGSLLRQ